MEESSGTLYAVLIGIDTYPAASGLPSLQGCCGDVSLLRELLEERVAAPDATGAPQLQVQVLLNAAATRHAVVEAIGTHLGKAGPGDVALLYFAGHGSQAACPPEFEEPDRMMEALVCYDSRTTAHDLADKELGYLLWKVSARHAHIVVILDACHAGSATRPGRTDTRAVAADPRQRPLAAFDVLPPEIRNQQGLPFITLPTGRYIALSACQETEQARETFFPQRQRTCGVFTHYLVQCLAQKHVPSYKEVLRAVAGRMYLTHPTQHPRLEKVGSATADIPFLGGTLRAVPPIYLVSYQAKEQAWVAQGGAIHGFDTGAAAYPLRLALFALDVPLAGATLSRAQMAQSAGTAVVHRVEPSRSLLTLEFEAVPDALFQAVVVQHATSAYTLAIDGDAAEVAALRAHLKDENEAGTLVLVREAIWDATPTFRLHTAAGGYSVNHIGPALILPLAGEAGRHRVLSSLEQMARWQQLYDLTPRARRLQDHMTLELALLDPVTREPVATRAAPPQNVFAYHAMGDGTQGAPTIGVRIRNRSGASLYLTVLALYDTYQVDMVGNFDSVRFTDLVQFRQQFPVPDTLRARGDREHRVVLKVIVSTAPIGNGYAWEQSPLEAPWAGAWNTQALLPFQDPHVPSGTLQVASGGENRDDALRGTWVMDDSEPASAGLELWDTKQVEFTIVVPQQ